MKFLLLFATILLFFSLSLAEQTSSHSKAPFEKIFGYKKVRLTLNSKSQNINFVLLFGLHHSGFIFRLTKKQLARDTTNFFRDACFLKPNSDIKNEYLAFLDYRLIDGCVFSTEEGGLYTGVNLVFSVRNHESANQESVWNIGIAPRLKLNKFCSGMTLVSFAKRMTETCKKRHDRLKTALKAFSDTGDHYYRSSYLIKDLKLKIKELHKRGEISAKEHENLLAKIKKSKYLLKLLRTDVAAAATNYLKSKQLLQEQLNGRLNKGALVAQIEKEATFAKNRYQAALRNLDHVKNKIIELLPEANALVRRAFFAADAGKHREILEKIRINT